MTSAIICLRIHSHQKCFLFHDVTVYYVDLCRFVLTFAITSLYTSYLSRENLLLCVFSILQARFDRFYVCHCYIWTGNIINIQLLYKNHKTTLDIELLVSISLFIFLGFFVHFEWLWNIINKHNSSLFIFVTQIENENIYIYWTILWFLSMKKSVVITKWFNRYGSTKQFEDYPDFFIKFISKNISKKRVRVKRHFRGMVNYLMACFVVDMDS